MGISPQQGTTTADQSHSAIAGDLQIGACQASGLPETLQKALGPVFIAARQCQDPALLGLFTGLLSRSVQHCKADLGPNPAGQLSAEVKSGQSKCTISELTGAVIHQLALTHWCNGLGISRHLTRVDQPVQRQGCITGHKPCRPGQLKWPVHDPQRALTSHSPPNTQCKGEQHHRHSDQSQQERAPFHEQAVKHMVLIFYPSMVLCQPEARLKR